MNCATTSQEDKGFNSKLVRLEVDETITLSRYSSFNSKLVRLEAKSDYEKKPFDSLGVRFNSKLVRLEVRNGFGVPQKIGVSFNSKLVRLEGF